MSLQVRDYQVNDCDLQPPPMMKENLNAVRGCQRSQIFWGIDSAH